MARPYTAEQKETITITQAAPQTITLSPAFEVCSSILIEVDSDDLDTTISVKGAVNGDLAIGDWAAVRYVPPGAATYVPAAATTIAVSGDTQLRMLITEPYPNMKLVFAVDGSADDHTGRVAIFGIQGGVEGAKE